MQWLLGEVLQIHSDEVPVPNLSLPSGLQLDPIAWRKEWTTTPGTTQRRCARVGSHADVRSDSFIVGNFASYIRDWDGTLEASKLYYVPLYPQATKPPLTLTAEPLDGQPADPVILINNVAYAFGATRDAFYATGTLLSHQRPLVPHRNRGAQLGMLRPDPLTTPLTQ